MRKRDKKIKFLFSLFLLMGVFLFAGQALAQVDTGANVVGNTIALSNRDPRTMIATIINVFLGILSIIAIGIVLLGGFKWMTSEGNEEKIAEAKRILSAGAIGLAIILASWGIAAFVMNQLIGATSGENASSTSSTNETHLDGGGGYGQSCDANHLKADGCQAGKCDAGLICDTDSSCTCLPGPGASCGPVNNGVCSPTTQCVTGSKCNSSCICEVCAPGDTSCTPLVKCNASNVNGQCLQDSSLCPSGQTCGTDCYCRSGQFGDPCDGDTTTPTCQADNSKCDKSQGLTCDPTNCHCAGSPVITGISPVGGFCANNNNKVCTTNADCSGSTCDNETPNGAPGNLISISGYNFGTSTGAVYFNNIIGGDPVTVNPACSTTNWSDNQIITVVPIAAAGASGPIKVVSGGIINPDLQNWDLSNDAAGPSFKDFIFNGIVRPGICSLTPNAGRYGTSLDLSGVNLSGAAYFGSYGSAVKAAATTFSSPLNATTKMPNITPGANSIFVQNATGFSNYFNVQKQTEPITGPAITDFNPVTGQSGQYVTIRGAGFGSAKGNSEVYFVKNDNSTSSKAAYNFPAVCLNSVWSDNQIIVKVPTGLPNGKYFIDLRIASWDVNTAPAPFTIDSAAALLPSLCKIEPTSGPNNSTVNLWGEYFGNGTANVYFNNGVPYSNAQILSDSGANKVTSVVPATPVAAITGPVKVSNSLGASNSLNFKVASCSKDVDCGSGTPICCAASSAKAGQCVTNQSACFANIFTSVFQWGISNGINCTGLDPAHCAEAVGCTEAGDGTCVSCSSSYTPDKQCGVPTNKCCIGPNSGDGCIGQKDGFGKDTNNGECVQCSSYSSTTCATASVSGCCLSANDICTGGTTDKTTGKCAITDCTKAKTETDCKKYGCNFIDGKCVDPTYSCADKGSDTKCPIGSCPNSPGTCGSDGTYQQIGVCTTISAGCGFVPGCDNNKCTFDPASNKCILNASTMCASSGTATTAGIETCTGGEWQAALSGSCPSGWSRDANNVCHSGKACSVCDSGFTCDGSSNKCVSAQLGQCPGGSTCTAGKCLSATKLNCDCCCTIGSGATKTQTDAQQCCGGTTPSGQAYQLTCGGTCGSGAGFGKCGGCSEVGTTVAAHDAACNCTNASGKFCKADNTCDDCTALGSVEQCQAHSSSCCWDDKSGSGKCRGGDGTVLTGANAGHCAYYGCNSTSTEIKTFEDPRDLAGNYLSANSSADEYCRAVQKCTSAGGSAGTNSGAGFNVCSCDASGCSGNNCSLTSFTKLAYISCSGCLAPCATPSIWTANFPYSDKPTCSVACATTPTDPSAVCAAVNSNSAPSDLANNCAEAGVCCLDDSGVCSVGTKLGNDNAECAYYHDCGCSTLSAYSTTSPNYISTSTCKTSCADSGLGQACMTPDKNSCSATICGANFNCLLPNGIVAPSPATTADALAGNCGTCCCAPAADPKNDACKSINDKLTCLAGNSVSSCSGPGRGLCCGCSKDSDCGSDTDGTGCGSDTCCDSRPTVSAVNPDGKNPVCRNAAFQVSFSTLMDKSTLNSKNVSLQEMNQGSCKAVIASLDGVKNPNFWQQIYNAVASLFSDSYHYIARALHFENEAIAGTNNGTNNCPVAATYAVDNTGGHTVLTVTPIGVMDAASNYQIVVNGQTDKTDRSIGTAGVLSAVEIGMAKASTTWSFVTMSSNNPTSGLCAIDSVKVTPANYLFQNNINDLNEVDNDASAPSFDTVNDSDKVYTFDALAKNKTILHPVSGYYWSWIKTLGKPEGTNNQVFSWSTFNHVLGDSYNNKWQLNVNSPTIVGDNDVITATISMSGIAGNVMGDGNGKSASTTATVFVCKDPWPPVKSDGSWSPMIDNNKCDLGGTCLPFNYQFYYCRDAGDPNTTADDLPALGTDYSSNGGSKIIRGTVNVCSNDKSKVCTTNNDCGGNACVSSILKESYFFYSN